MNLKKEEISYSNNFTALASSQLAVSVAALFNYEVKSRFLPCSFRSLRGKLRNIVLLLHSFCSRHHLLIQISFYTHVFQFMRINGDSSLV